MTVTSTVARRPAQIELSGVTKRFLTPSGSMFTALRAIDLPVRAGLAGVEQDHPLQLWGGTRKRVSLPAALITEPSSLLMDEPCGALGVQTKPIMSNGLLGWCEETRPSVIFGGHDLGEAIALAD